LLNRLLIVAIAGGLLPLAAKAWWVFELTAHFRLQYAVPACLLLVIALLCRRRVLPALLAVVIGLNLWPLWPYLPTRAEASTGTPVSLLNVNVNGDNFAYAAILAMIDAADADVVTLIELTPELTDRLAVLRDRYPYQVTDPESGFFGLGILSKHALKATTSFDLGPTTALLTEVSVSGQTLHVLAAHPMPPMSAELAATRNAQLEQLAGIVRDGPTPLVVCGDFNLTPYSPYFADFEAAAGVTNVRRGRGIDFSWPSQLPILGIPIDHCFVRGALASRRVERLAGFGSDHYPVRVDITIRDSL